MSDIPIAMISSTARDLPDYRQQVLDACMRAGFHPSMMEHLPALDADAIEASLALVDEAEVYVGIFAHRYGYIPDGHDISITQMEYERAVKRGIPRLVFIMSDEVAVLPKDYDQGEKAEKLADLKSRLKKERVVNFFKNPEDIRGLVLNALYELKDSISEAKPAEKASASLHYVSAIPPKPEPYIAHPYTLLQVKGLVGRKGELELLTDWITKPDFRDITILNIIAIGGMGKSALTWKWFNDIAPQEANWAGRLWWSFYESDATFENFVARALAYVCGTTLDEVNKMSFMDQQNALLHALDHEPHLLVLDGLERILIAYARQDAAFLRDDTALDDETANRVAGAAGLPQSAGQSFVGRHQLRKTADVRAGQFLRTLSKIRNSRILVSSRLYPADLQYPNGYPCSGCFALFLKGLSDSDALELWRTYGAKGARETMLPVFQTFDKHPLLIQLLASEVAGFHAAPGDFNAWRDAHPDFNPFDGPIVKVQNDILAHALNGLSEAEKRTLHVIAGFRMPAAMETVKALLLRGEKDADQKKQPFADLGKLDRALTALEDRGLLGWDRRANRYDLHPIVRGVVWNGLSKTARLDVYTTLRGHFEAMPMIEDYLQVECLEDLTPAIELYNTLIGLGQYEEAYIIFRDRLEKATLYRLSASRLRIELLQRLFPDGPKTLPPLDSTRKQSFTLNALAQGYQLSGQSGAAIPLYERVEAIVAQEDDQKNRATCLENMSDALRPAGYLYRAAAAARTALGISRDRQDRFGEGASLLYLGLALAACGDHVSVETALQRSLRIFIEQKNQQGKGLVNAYLAQLKLWGDEPKDAAIHAQRAWELAAVLRNEGDFIRAARLQGSAALCLDDYSKAEEWLNKALTRARAVQFVEEELPALVDLAELHRRQGETEKARERLEEVWEYAERGPYPLWHADALNVLARIEKDAGNMEKAVEAATEAYKKAWCDGPPWAYDYGLRNAKALLVELGASEPELPAFDPSKFEPMPDVEINPQDEFWVDPDNLEMD